MSSLKKKKIIASVSLLALSAAIVGTALATPVKSTMVMIDSHSAPVSSAPAPAAASNSAAAYKDGSYSAIGKYYSPGGQESIKVSLTLKNGVVASSSVESGANDPTATSYQSIFINGYQKFVVGKKISSIKVANVSGSSLTSQGFENALKQIEQQAKA